MRSSFLIGYFHSLSGTCNWFLRVTSVFVSCSCYVLLLLYYVTALSSSYLKFEMNDLVNIAFADKRKEIASLCKMFCSIF